MLYFLYCIHTELAREMNFTVDEINHIRLENPNSLTAQSFMLLKKWVSREGKNATSKSIPYIWRSDYFLPLCDSSAFYQRQKKFVTLVGGEVSSF